MKVPHPRQTRVLDLSIAARCTTLHLRVLKSTFNNYIFMHVHTQPTFLWQLTLTILLFVSEWMGWMMLLLCLFFFIALKIKIIMSRVETLNSNCRRREDIQDGMSSQIWLLNFIEVLFTSLSKANQNTILLEILKHFDFVQNWKHVKLSCIAISLILFLITCSLFYHLSVLFLF